MLAVQTNVLNFCRVKIARGRVLLVVSCLWQGCDLSVSGASGHLLAVNGRGVILPSGFTTS